MESLSRLKSEETSSNDAAEISDNPDVEIFFMRSGSKLELDQSKVIGFEQRFIDSFRSELDFNRLTLQSMSSL